MHVSLGLVYAIVPLSGLLMLFVIVGGIVKGGHRYRGSCGSRLVRPGPRSHLRHNYPEGVTFHFAEQPEDDRRGEMFLICTSTAMS